MRPSTKGQVQMGELVIVLIIFFMILGFALIFFGKYMEGEASKTVTDIERVNLAETAKIISSLPEIHCSFAGDEDLSCIDMVKGEEMATLLADQERLHYAELFHGYKAEVHCLYPACSSDIQLFDYLPASAPNSQEFLLPIIVYDARTGTHNYGTLIITQLT